MRFLKKISLLVLLVLGSAQRAAYCGHKITHTQRALISGVLFVAAVVADIAKTSDIDAVDKLEGLLDTRSFTEKLVDRCVAICSSQNWKNLGQEFAQVFVAKHGESRDFLSRLWRFLSTHKLISVATLFNVGNAGFSFYQVMGQKMEAGPVVDREQDLSKPVSRSASVETEKPQSVDRVEIVKAKNTKKHELKRKVRFRPARQYVRRLRKEKKARARELERQRLLGLPAEHISADQTVLEAPSMIPVHCHELVAAQGTREYQTPARVKSEEKPSPQTEFISPSEFGATQPWGDGQAIATPTKIITFLRSVVAQRRKMRLSKPVVVMGQKGGKPRSRGMTKGYSFDNGAENTLLRAFDVPWYLQPSEPLIVVTKAEDCDTPGKGVLASPKSSREPFKDCNFAFQQPSSELKGSTRPLSENKVPLTVL